LAHKKYPGQTRDQACQAKIVSRSFTQPIRARKPEWGRTDSGTSYRLSKWLYASLSSRVASSNLRAYHACA